MAKTNTAYPTDVIMRENKQECFTRKSVRDVTQNSLELKSTRRTKPENERNL